MIYIKIKMCPLKKGTSAASNLARTGVMILYDTLSCNDMCHSIHNVLNILLPLENGTIVYHKACSTISIVLYSVILYSISHHTLP